MTVKIIPEKLRDVQISLKDEQDDHALTKVRLEDCSKELKELIIVSNEKVGELNRDLETIPYEKKLSDPEKLEFRNTIDGLKQELSRYDHSPSAYRIMEESVVDLEEENSRLETDVTELGNTVQVLIKEGGELSREKEKLSRYVMQLKTAIDTLIEETVT